MRYFRFFPKDSYNNVMMTNIIVRARVKEKILTNAVVLYPYTLQDGDRPDIVAHKYYGSVDFTWMVLLANDIIDPHYDWPLSQKDFNSYIIAKYGSLEGPTQTVYEYRNAKGFVIDETTYNATPVVEREVVTVWEYESDLNESKRYIKLIDNDYTMMLVDELKEIFR